MSIYSMQVLDRVLSTGSLETLLMLSMIMMIIFIVISVMQIIRSFIFIRLGESIDQKLSSNLIRQSLSFNNQYSASQSMRDLITLKSFFSGPTFVHILDAPWAILFLIGIFYIHPLNGWVTIFGAICLLILTFLNEKLTKKDLKKANDFQVKHMRELDSTTQNVEVIEAMGMTNGIIKNWQESNAVFNLHLVRASLRAAVVAAVTKGGRLMIQMVTMATGAVLVLSDYMSAGGIIATSILAGKALAPFDASVGILNSLVDVKKACARLNHVLNDSGDNLLPLKLPKPTGVLDIQKCVYVLPESKQMVLKGLSASIAVGQCVGIIGASGSGKTTLARLLMGVLQPTQGFVRLDGAKIDAWNKQELGQYIGYLPQDTELFSGSVQENIARMNKSVSSDEIIKAAMFTDTHHLILGLPQGYSTNIGVSGHHLSAGKRQRIALARAFFGEPKLVVLDEPDSNLDKDGEIALIETLKRAQNKGVTVIIISHKRAVLNIVDRIMVLQQGQIKFFDSRDQVLEKLSKPTELATETSLANGAIKSQIGSVV